MNELNVLMRFLNHPVWRSDQIFEEFMETKDAVFHRNESNPKEAFLYIPGTRKDRVVLVAHADTVWDECYIRQRKDQKIKLEDGVIRGTNPKAGIGADDRAGCAMLYLLRKSGHSVLITDGEEHGRQGSQYLVNQFPELCSELNSHRFMVQVDRRNARDFKCYDVGSADFRKFIHETTAYTEPDRFSYTDIVTLCRRICGVNLSIGYYDEHTSNEHLILEEWLRTYKILSRLLTEPLPEFLLDSPNA
jgi:hypothetical protein